jgi:hypothetical protein
MIESPLLKELEEAAENRGREGGIVEGVVTILEDRFGGISESLIAELHSVKDVEKLKAIFRTALHCSEIAEFESELIRLK